jgi:hypothetical protein
MTESVENCTEQWRIPIKVKGVCGDWRYMRAQNPILLPRFSTPHVDLAKDSIDRCCYSPLLLKSTTIQDGTCPLFPPFLGLLIWLRIVGVERILARSLVIASIFACDPAILCPRLLVLLRWYFAFLRIRASVLAGFAEHSCIIPSLLLLDSIIRWFLIKRGRERPRMIDAHRQRC